MTNLYVSGYGISAYTDLSSSPTLTNANKVIKNFIQTAYKQSLYLDENHNLYGDINGNNLIDTNVTEIYTAWKAYLKNDRLYIYQNNTWVMFQDQIKEVLQVFDKEYDGVVYNDFNNKTHFRTFDNRYNIVFTQYFKEFIYMFDSAYYCYGLTEDGKLYGATAPRYTLQAKTIDGVVEHLLPIVRWNSGSYFNNWVIINGKVAELRIYTAGSGNPSIYNANVLNMEEDEVVVNYLPKKENYHVRYNSYSVDQYVITTNKNTYFENRYHSYFDGVDGNFIISIDASNIATSSDGPYFACTSLIEYPLTIYEGDNETVATTINVLPFNYTSITVNGTTATLSLHSVIDTYYNVVFQIENRKGYGFVGLSQTPNSNTPEIPLEGTMNIWSGELSFYQVYQKALPADAVQATLYYNSAEPNRINKRNFLTKYRDIVGVFRSSVSIEDPVLVLELNEFPSFNYVYIKNFNRYYFVRGRDNISKNIYSLTLHVDPLYSFMNEIKNVTAQVLRSSITSKQNPYIIDSLQPLKNTNIINRYELENTVFNNDNETWKNNYNYVLNVLRALNLKNTHEFEIWQN